MTSKKSVDEAGLSAKSEGPYLNKVDRKLFVLGLGVLVLLMLVLALLSGGKERARTELYKDASGAAGLQASITYDGKSLSGSNIYILREDGQQAAVVQPDKHGTINLALPGGNYVMLIGKRVRDDKVFPEEPLALKNGKRLELKLRY